MYEHNIICKRNAKSVIDHAEHIYVYACSLSHIYNRLYVIICIGSDDAPIRNQKQKFKFKCYQSQCTAVAVVDEDDDTYKLTRSNKYFRTNILDT